CLTTVEKLALRPFLLSGRVSNNKVEGAEVESLEQRLKKRRCLEAREAGYRLVGSIPATSNKVEQFLSVARRPLGMNEWLAAHCAGNDSLLTRKRPFLGGFYGRPTHLAVALHVNQYKHKLNA
ncbi:hypothetical protein F441_11363, partial [Phytophthora nicotianae CJ01A1]